MKSPVEITICAVSLVVAGSFAVPMQGQTCGSPAITSSPTEFEFNGGTGHITVLASSGCQWIAVNHNPELLELTSQINGLGLGTVNYRMKPGAKPGSAEVTTSLGRSVSIIRKKMPADSPVVTLSPQQGKGAAQRFFISFPATLSGPYSGIPSEGAITDAGLLIGSETSGSSGCLITYNRARAQFQVPNSACTLLSSSTAERDTPGGKIIDLVLDISFSPQLTGVQTLYTRYTVLDTAISWWVPMGRWDTTGAAPQPYLIDLKPVAGVGPANFTATYYHPSGPNAHYLLYLLLLPLPNTLNYTAQNTCLVEHNHISQRFRLIDNPGTGWSSPANSGTLSNLVCTLDVSNSHVIPSDNLLTMTAALSFAGEQKVFGTFLQEQDVTGQWSPITQFGNWQANPTQPYNPTGPFLFIANNSFDRHSFLVTDTLGYDKITMMHYRIGDSILDPNYCHVIFFPQSDTLNLVNEAGTALVSATGVPIGSAATLENSRCSVDTSTVNQSKFDVLGQGRILTSFTVTPKGSFRGRKFVYVNIFDNGGLLTHWITGNTWEVY